MGKQSGEIGKALRRWRTTLVSVEHEERGGAEGFEASRWPQLKEEQCKNGSLGKAIWKCRQCLAQPSDVELLAPLIVDEILIPLLRSHIGPRVAQMGFAESSVYRLAKAMRWLRANFIQPMKVEELAELVHMSASSFHEHFKSVTSMSPLHYQKVLRLQEARRLMLSARMDAGTAGQRVGYLSASQFSREYSRLFRIAPGRDIARLRNDAQAEV